MFQKVSDGLPPYTTFVRAKCMVTGHIFTAYFDSKNQVFRNEVGDVIVFGDPETRPDDQWEIETDVFNQAVFNQECNEHDRSVFCGSPQAVHSFDQKIIQDLKTAARRKIICIDLCDEDGTFNTDDWFGGNMDDAYSRGKLDGEAELARTILTAIGETW